MTALTKSRDTAVFPTSPVQSDIWIDTKTDEAYVYNNGSWILIAYDVEEMTHWCDWVWEQSTIKIHNDEWWIDNKFEIFDWLVDYDIKWNWKSVNELQLKELSDELKTMFTLRWK